ncbi:hypothetical protein F511_05301 [Dorcoceras hygrometricum]|uniref:Uncharacterized protein n=1 Tax=Dorcoceras hygrometricum TaxID=472368 RepID=A0A2Z7BR82_9LAMI|nr:hypothetical protein F511_05301 [Dorcoceras hygrometricum]
MHDTAATGWPKQRPTLGRQARQARHDRAHMCARGKGRGAAIRGGAVAGMLKLCFDFKIRDLIQSWHKNVLKDPSLCSDTTVGLRTCVTLNGSGIQLAVGPQPLRLRNHNFGLAHRIMVKRLETSPHDPLGITDSACKNQLVVVSVQYGPFNTYIPIRSTTIGKSRVARDPIAMHASWRSNSDIASVTSIGYPRMKARGESSTTKHRLLHASGPHPIPPPNDPKTNQYNQDLGLIHSTNGNHLESPNEVSSIDHQVTIHLHAQNIIMFPTNETWYFTSQMLVSSSGGLILILTAQSTRNEFRIHSDY